jgi:hypothetical protein
LHVELKNVKKMTSIIITTGAEMVSLPVPPAYIGKRIEVTFTLIDEIAKPKRKLSEILSSALSKESAESFREHIERMREEWDTI